ncbi:HupE/UreJ family protein [Falsirhodobacter algicola]|uniref:HupE/UreJ family protein n=1 Tax=Falsirhodobacter algicola TaxID=2692330 RepID=A0A8J8MTG2_9RHOB|nr:HupE/UreJ family protein [Falsirhodobacter algicola]QUS36365.1 HupE/UreJ family protein [Falsirhodobacter algicola]
MKKTVMIKTHALRPLLSVWVAMMLWFVGAELAVSHPLQPAVVTVTVGTDRVDVTVHDTLEPMIAIGRIDPKSQRDAQKVNDLYADLRASAPDIVEAAFREQWPDVARRIGVYAGTTRLDLTLGSVTEVEIGDMSQLRFGTFTFSAPLPDDGSPVTMGWTDDFGELAIHQAGAADDEGYTQILPGGQMSQPMPRAAPVKEGVVPVLARFIVAGFEHIVPKGTDHILFVLGLFFFSLRVRALLAQVTAFTLAHSVTLALASLGIVTLPASVVEPLIAVSIVYVAVENVIFAKRRTVTYARVGVVFGFGLLHGLGFASVLSDVGLHAGQFVTGLIGFNLGVELGQLCVIALAFLVLGLPFGRKPWYRARIAVPASCAIAAMGLYWTIERVI